MLGALLWGIGASMALAEENEKAKTKNVEEELEIDNKRLDFNEKVQFVVKKEELKEQNIRLNRLCFDYLEKEKRITELEKENAELKEKLKPENCLKLLAKEGYIKFSSEQLTYAKTIIQDLLDNTDEYARQRAEDFLKESE